MIPQADIIAWRRVAPWADDAMVEQDLVHGRDLFDLWDASRRGDVNPARVIQVFQEYLKADDLRVTRAEFERNLAAKARNRLFIEEVTPMLAPGIAYDARAALDFIHGEFIERLPGDAWKGG